MTDIAEKFRAVNIRIIWSQEHNLPFNAFINIFHLNKHLANAAVVILLFIYLFIYFQPYLYLPSLELLLYYPIMLWLSPQKLTFDKNSTQAKHSMVLLHHP
jgi:hypothetical protein